MMTGVKRSGDLLELFVDAEPDSLDLGLVSLWVLLHGVLDLAGSGAAFAHQNEDLLFHRLFAHAFDIPCFAANPLRAYLRFSFKGD